MKLGCAEPEPLPVLLLREPKVVLVLFLRELKVLPVPALGAPETGGCCGSG
ncbi:hypothetical protein [Streptomyces sp. NPDC058486]|uniref:hypothetical protein n=1 Tax=unclassified Streptomyces TaxID=2593676 RepID=UPI0036662AF8